METPAKTDKKAAFYWVMDEAGCLHLVKDFDTENMIDWMKFFRLTLNFSQN